MHTYIQEYAPETLVIVRNSARDAIKGQKMGKRWRGLYKVVEYKGKGVYSLQSCLLYTSPSPRDATLSRMPSSA